MAKTCDDKQGHGSALTQDCEGPARQGSELREMGIARLGSARAMNRAPTNCKGSAQMEQHRNGSALFGPQGSVLRMNSIGRRFDEAQGGERVVHGLELSCRVAALWSSEKSCAGEAASSWETEGRRSGRIRSVGKRCCVVKPRSAEVWRRGAGTCRVWQRKSLVKRSQVSPRQSVDLGRQCGARRGSAAALNGVRCWAARGKSLAKPRFEMATQGGVLI